MPSRGQIKDLVTAFMLLERNMRADFTLAKVIIKTKVINNNNYKIPNHVFYKTCK